MRGALTLAGLVFSLPALAYDAPPPHSFVKPTANGKYVLVMLHPLERPADKGMRAKYGCSGLYPVNDPTKPSWTCDWRADWDRNVLASDDGVYAIRVPDLDPGLRHWVLSYEKTLPPKVAGWEDAPALWIYKNGQPFRTVALKDAFNTSRFSDRDCYMGPVVAIDSFEDGAGRVTISTEVQERKQTATVAFRTGEVKEAGKVGERVANGSDPDEGDSPAGGTRWGRMILLGLAVVAVCTAAFVGLAALLVRKKRQRV